MASIKAVLTKMGKKGQLTQDELDKIVFKLNAHQTAKEGSALERFYMRPIKTYLPELIRKQIDHQALIAARRERQRKLAEKLGRRSKDHFEPGDKVVLQDVVSLKWRVKGIIIEGRISEDGTGRSYLVKKENGKTTIRSARHIRFAARRENLRVRFEESISNEVSDDSGNEASLDSANDGMDTGNEVKQVMSQCVA